MKNWKTGTIFPINNKIRKYVYVKSPYSRVVYKCVVHKISSVFYRMYLCNDSNVVAVGQSIEDCYDYIREILIAQEEELKNLEIARTLIAYNYAGFEETD